jgi:hypothetical protein
VSAEVERPDLGGAAAELDAADRAILRTVVYAALFEAPLDLDELHRALADVRLEKDALRARLESPALSRHLTFRDALVHPRGRDAWRELRAGRREHARSLVARHGRALGLLERFPFVRLAALSGACAHENATDDDVDVFLVVKKGRAWSVYLALVLLSRLLGVRRTLCLNYILDESALALPERDVFTATEIVGLRPRAGGEGYRAFVRANEGMLAGFPNFLAGYEREAQALPRAGAAPWLERLLDHTAAPLVEALSRRLMGARLRRKGRGRPGVVLAPHRLKLHTHDHRPGLNAAYHTALAEVDGSLPEGA